MTKYPRTLHLPWSPGYTSDDILLVDTKHFEGKIVIVTEKLDGENTTMYCDAIHARSLSSSDHPSRHYVKAIHAGIKHNIPPNWRVCGENLYAKHSIFYPELTSYFLVFSIWDGTRCLSYKDTVVETTRLGLYHVPVLYYGVWDEEAVKSCFTGISRYGPEAEGYVIRVADSFEYDEFNMNVAKFVRPSHVTTDEHWMSKEVVPNCLSS